MSREEQLSDRRFRAKVVALILDARPEAALRLLSDYYGIRQPSLRVGTVKRYRRVLGCYLPREARIYVSHSTVLTDPFTILHEFYHHLRASGAGRRRQVEKRADLFAIKFMRDYRAVSVGSKSLD